jgi:hypothetical protein
VVAVSLGFQSMGGKKQISHENFNQICNIKDALHERNTPTNRRASVNAYLKLWNSNVNDTKTEAETFRYRSLLSERIQNVLMCSKK